MLCFFLKGRNKFIDSTDTAGGEGLLRIDRLPCLLARSIKADTVARCINCLFAMRPLTAQISSTGWSGCVYVLHSLPTTSTRTATRNLSFIKTHNSHGRWWLLCLRAHVLARFLPPQLPPSERARDRAASQTKQIQLAAYDFAFKATLGWAFRINAFII